MSCVVPHGINSRKFCEVFKVPVADSGRYREHRLTITHTNDADEADAFLRAFCKSGTDIGFDLEHKPTFIKGQQPNVALLQIAPLIRDRLEQHFHPVLLFSVYHNGGQIPQAIRRVLLDTKGFKFGVGVKGDYRHLRYLQPAPEVKSSYRELGTMAFELDIAARPGLGLKELTSKVLGVECTEYKTKSLTMTNWEVFGLSVAQLRYAAMDAWVSIELYKRLADYNSLRICGKKMRWDIV